MKRLLALVVLLLCGVAEAGPNVLSNTMHAALKINAAITAVGGAGIVDVSILTDATSTDDGLAFLTNSGFITAATASTLYYQVANNANMRNDQPYTVITQSSLGYSLSLEQTNYTALYNSGTMILYNMPMVYPTPGISPPPAMMTNIMCPCNPNNGLGGGTEFTMSSSYMGLDTTTSSNTTAAFAGILALMQFNHSTWTWGDIKGALRQTASKWSTGWNADYGTIDYTSATAIASTSSIYLQPPDIVATTPSVNHISITVYPFRSTRRHHEVVYIVPVNYAFPAPSTRNEFTSTDITNMTNAGAMLLFTGNNTDVVPASGTISLPSNLMPGLYELVGFTTDNAGGYSRVEKFSAIPVTNNCN